MAKKPATLPKDLKIHISIYSESKGINLSFDSIADAKKCDDETVKAFIDKLTA